MSRFTAKSVIVTGSSTGIGRSAAILFASEGASVTIHGRKVDALETTRQSLLKAGSDDSRINVVVGDITAAETQKNLVETTLAKFGKIDILVNNAGAAISCSDPTKERFDVPQDIFLKTMDVNVNSVMSLITLARPHLIATKGEIINISSIVALNVAVPGFPYYAISKAALDQFTRALAVDLIPHGVRVNSVNPGAVATPFLNNCGLPDEATQKYWNYLEANSSSLLPLGTVGRPEHIADVIAYLAHRPTSYYIVGQCIIADGGSSLLMPICNLDMKAMLASGN